MASEIDSSSASKADLFPRGGWDTHHHIFDPATFPYSPTRHLTPPAATADDYDKFAKDVGLTKCVLTQGLSYGTDTSSLKAFTAQLGDRAAAAICVIDPEASTDEQLKDLQDNGIRGLRVNLYHFKAMEDVDLQKKALLAHLKRVRDLSLPWSLTMTTIRTEFWDILEPFVREHIAKSGIPLITDHFGLLKAPSMLSDVYKDDPTAQPGFAAIMRLVQDGCLYVKLSAPYRLSTVSPYYEDLRFLVRAFMDANKHQVLWGSDWPHTPIMRV
ncbi:hypothetical protein ACHAPJ_009042 [Fusarium lateritium]